MMQSVEGPEVVYNGTIGVAMQRLTKSEERELLVQYYTNNDTSALDKILTSNLRYVIHVSKKYASYGLPMEDIIQQGNLGLVKAAKKFSLDYDVRYATFASHYVRAEICDYVLRNYKMAKIVTTKSHRKLFFNLRKLKTSVGTSPDARHKIAEHLQVSHNDVLDMEGVFYSHDVSFDVEDSEDETSFGPASYLSIGETEDPSWITQKDASDASNSITKALQTLPKRSQDIMQRRWLTNVKKATFHELSISHGVSIERIRQIEAQAFSTLRPMLAECA